MSEKLSILGIKVDSLTAGAALERVAALVAAGGAHHVVTVNPEFVVLARRDRSFRRILNGADLALADGIGLIVASRFLGRPLPERVTGTDTTERLASLAAQRGYRVFLLGGEDGVAAAAAAVLERRYPGLHVAGTFAGSPAVDEEEDIVARVREARPELLFVAYGAPQQDEWIDRNLPRLGDLVAMGVGGAFDFISGRVPRSPLWLQRLGLEWLYRLVRQPWRWRRMLRLPRFVWLVVGARLSGRSFDNDPNETYT